MEISKKGFLLTAKTDGKQLIYFVKAEDGKVYQLKVVDRPVFFVSSEQGDLPGSKHIERKSLPLMNFQKANVDALYFQNFHDLQNSRQILKEQNITLYESDVLPHERYLMERFIFGAIEFVGEVSAGNIVMNPKMRACDAEVNFRVMSFDIETSLHNDLYSIAYHLFEGDQQVKKVLMVGNPYESNETLEFFDNEEKLLSRFFVDFKKLDPDLIIGWHVIGFDFEFLMRKARQYKIPSTLGRNNDKLYIEDRERAGWMARMDGRVVLDGPATLKSNFFQYENFKLETVANEVLGTGKEIDHSAGKVEEINRMFKEDKQALAKYNIIDCVLVSDIFKKLKLIELMTKRVKVSGLLFDRLGVSTKAFDHLYLPKLHRLGFVGPDIMDIEQGEQSTGGFVIEPSPGLYENVALLDFKSLYPTVMQTFFIDPLARLHGELGEGESITLPTGHKMSPEFNILKDIISSLLKDRAQAKLSNDEPLSFAIKILMNSLYGVMGSYGCRFYHYDLPTAITQTGQFIIKETQNYVQNQFQKNVIYGDTDSIFVHVTNDASEEYCFSICKQINEYWQERLSTEFKVESYLEMEFESLFSKFILPKARGLDNSKGAKKRYVAFSNEEVLFKGMEAVRSDWTKLAKRFQNGLYMTLFQDGQNAMEDFIRSFLSDFKSGIYNDECVYQKRLRKKASEYIKTTPPHVKAARIAGIEKGNIQYVMTVRGPIPLSSPHSDLDYQHYIEKQIKPIADSLLPIFQLSFDSMNEGSQLSLF
jgi:DNA polymerase-2